MNCKNILILSLFVFLLNVIFGQSSYKVKKVIKGNKILLKDNEKIKFLGIKLVNIDSNFCKTVLNYTDNLLKRRSVTIEYDKKYNPDSNDTFQSAYVFFICDTCAGAKFNENKKVGNVISYSAPLINMSQLLIEKGYAVVDTTIDFSKKSYYKYLQKKAKRSQKGMWAYKKAQ